MFCGFFVMKEKVPTKRVRVKKPVDEKPVVEPFAETVEPPRVSSPPVSKRSRVAKTASTESKPAKTTVRKPRKKAAVDPFAEIAAPEPAVTLIKKRAKKSEAKRESEPGAVATGSAKRKTVKPTKPTLDATSELAATEPAVELS